MAASSSGSPSSPRSRHGSRLLLALAGLSFIGSTVVAYRQEPRPNPLQPVATWTDWWRYPLERNAFKRLPVLTADLNAISVVPRTEHVWAVGSGGMVVHSTDGGRTWAQRPIALTTATPQEQPTQSAPAKGAFLRLPELVPSAHADGGKSQAQQAPQNQAATQKNAPLQTPPEQQKQPNVQPSKTISPAADKLATPGPIPPPPRPETASLFDVQFINDEEGWIVGEGGTILHTTDGGATWLPQSRSKRSEAEEAATYHMWFAPWYYPVGWLLPLLLLFVASRHPEAPTPDEPESVANHAVSDRPLEAGDPDSLGLGIIARGLASFLQNEKTEPPLTIAVTGAWGTGKSSLINLLALGQTLRQQGALSGHAATGGNGRRSRATARADSRIVTGGVERSVTPVS